jgi:cytosine/adenosine deaminase-related metal-dependent hydrolase
VGEHLSEKGVLGEKTLSAHCVHVNQNEINLLAKTNTKVSHQPRSNMNNAVGIAPVQKMLDSGVCVGLGNDGFSNNMYSEMKAAYLVHKSAAHDPRAMTGNTVLRLAYENNAHIASLFWPRPRDYTRRMPISYSRLPHTRRPPQPALADHLWRH